MQLAKLPSAKKIQKAKVSLNNLEMAQKKSLALMNLDDEDVHFVHALVGFGIIILGVCVATQDIWNLSWSGTGVVAFFALMFTAISGGWVPAIVCVFIHMLFRGPYLLLCELRISRAKKLAQVHEKLLAQATAGFSSKETYVDSMKQMVTNLVSHERFEVDTQKFQEFLAQWRKDALALEEMEYSHIQLYNYPKEQAIVEEAIADCEKDLQKLRSDFVMQVAKPALDVASMYPDICHDLEHNFLSDINLMKAALDLGLEMEAYEQVMAAVAEAEKAREKQLIQRDLVNATPGLRIALERRAQKELTPAS